MKNKAVQMLHPPATPSEPDRLDSWKEIARYLRRGARTVQRWEREEGLPVHRLQHEKLGSVYAYRSELDAWFAGRGAELEPESAPPLSPEPSLAVLPFTDMSQEGDQAYFCDGIAEEIVSALSRVKGLRTASRTSSFRFRTHATDSREIGRQMGVKALLEGSVRKSGDRLRIAVQLIDTESGFQLWAHRYDRTSNDILGIQEKVAESVVQALKVTLTLKDQGGSQPSPSTDISAYDCYQRGRKYYDEYSPQAMEFAIDLFVRAIGLDPHYTDAYAGLADCWSYTYLYAGRSEAVREQADWASLKALELDPESAQALASRGFWLSLSGLQDESDRAFEAAIRLDPDLFEAHYFRARHCFASGRSVEAIAAYQHALRIRPDDYQSPLLLAQLEDDLGHRDEAVAARRQGVGIAERHLEWNPADARALYLAANGLAALGENNRSRRLAERAAAIRPDDPVLLYNVGCVFSLLGLTEPALDCLEKGVRGGHLQRDWYRRDSNLDSLRALPRFQSLLREMN